MRYAQSRYLQDELASLVVNSQFNSDTTKLFRALEKNTSDLNSSSLETFGSGRHRGAFQSGGQRSDVFNQFTNGNFPRRQWAKQACNQNSAARGAMIFLGGAITYNKLSYGQLKYKL